MTGVGSAPRDFAAFQTWVKKRITALERRQGGGAAFELPPRLGEYGREVTDFNTEVIAGFYWATPNALNKPPVGTFVSGQIYVNRYPSFERVVQRAQVPSSPGVLVEWVRLGFSPVGSPPSYSWGAWRRMDGVRTPPDIGTITGGTFDNNRGRINLTAGVKELIVPGCFITEYDRYRIDYNISTPGGDNRWLLILRQGTTDRFAGAYQYQNFYASGTGTPATQQGTNQNNYPLSVQALANNHGWFTVDNPRTTVAGAGVAFASHNGGFPVSGGTVNSNLTTGSGFLSGEEAVSIDGFRIILANTALAGVGAGSWLKIVGIA